MPTPAQCGLRIAHDQHLMDDGGTCPGKPWPVHYDPKHCCRGQYKPELNWTAEASPRAGRHRAEGDARLTDEPHPPRPWLRLGWRDDDKDEDGSAAAWVVAMCMILASFTGMSATSAMTSFDQLLRTPVLIAKKE